MRGSSSTSSTTSGALRRAAPACAKCRLAAAFVQAALSREFGLAGTPRADGPRDEIAGITQADIDVFSSRRDSLTTKQAELAEQFRSKYGRAPNQPGFMTIHMVATVRDSPRAARLTRRRHARAGRTQ